MSWRALKEGDVVDIVAPASGTKREELENGLDFLRSWGLRPRVQKNILGRDRICSNTDEIRFSQLKEALQATDSSAVWCLRGGYGANRLVPELARLTRPARSAEKLFVGYSDITTVHTFLNQKWGWSTIHGPMVDRLGKRTAKPAMTKELKQLVFGEKNEIGFEGLKALNTCAKKKHEIHAPVTGGNLITLQSTIGTAIPWSGQGSIVFFEEIGERGYRLDRIFEHLIQSGALMGAKAVVFGDMIGGQEVDGTSQVGAVIQRFADRLEDIPVLKGIKAGHGPVQRPVPFHTPSVLEISSGGATLNCATGVIAAKGKIG